MLPRFAPADRAVEPNKMRTFFLDSDVWDVYGTGTIPADGLRPEDYRPTHFDEVAELMRLKSFRSVDHHHDE